MSFISELFELYRSRVRLPKSRRIPKRYETVSIDGWSYGEVALVLVGSFEPVDDAFRLLETALSDDADDKGYRTLPVWLRINGSKSRPDVMSGKDRIGTIAADPVYLPLLLRACSQVGDLVADGTILAKIDGGQARFKKLKVHVYRNLDGSNRA